MTTEEFFKKFDQFAGAPNAAKKMRELILELAVQGKLVEQLSTEGNGQSLLLQIRVKKNTYGLPDDIDSDGENSLSIPKSWAQGELGEVSEIVRGVTFPGSGKSMYRTNGDVACLRTASVQSEIDWEDLIFIASSYVGRSDQWIQRNDILISMANSYELVGKVAIVRNVPQKATFGAFLAAIRPICINPFFLLYVLRCPTMQAAFRSSSSQTTNIANISLGRMRPLPFPLPPIAEQKRIVAKVDKLMALCDRLEVQEAERREKGQRLSRAALAQFTKKPIVDSLGLIFHKDYEVEPGEIRKAILELAVRGKLVEQEPDDEPISVLYKKISGEKARLINKGIIKRQETDPIGNDEYLFNIPPSWMWTRLGEIGDWGSGSTPTRGNHEYFGGGITWLKSGELNDNQALSGSEETVSELALKNGSFRQNKAGDVLLAMYGATIGKVAILSEPAVTNQAVCGCTPFCSIMNRFLFYYLVSQRASFHAASEGGAQPNISKMKTVNFPFPLPPLAEQKRIVAKVDELMALVDKLEAQQKRERELAERLIDAAVREMTA